MNRHLLVPLFVVVFGTSLLTVAVTADDPANSVKVPDLTGLSAAEAKAAAVKAGFVAKFQLGEPAASREAAQTVYAQTPAAGKMLARGEVIKLTIYAASNGTASPTARKPAPATSSLAPDGSIKVPALDGQSSKEVATASQVHNEVRLKRLPPRRSAAELLSLINACRRCRFA